MKANREQGKNPDKSKASTTPPLKAQQGSGPVSSAAKRADQKTLDDDMQDRKNTGKRRDVQ
ncbi:MAG: hypothetical protein U0T73_12665 [Chitinophagales bacterium]